MANWLQGKGFNKLCAVFKGISILIFLNILIFLDSGFEYMNVLSCVYNEIPYLLPAIQYQQCFSVFVILNADYLLYL